MDTILFGQVDWSVTKTAAIACIAAPIAIVALRHIKGLSSKKLPLPPGPRGLPFIGNALDIPQDNPWETYKGWSDQYGSDIIHLKVLGGDLIVLDSLEACKELLEKRSSIYSSRPRMTMMNELLGFSWHFAFMPYNEEWRERRKIFQQALHPTRVEAYRERLVRGVRNLLLQLLDDPDNFRGHGRLLSGAFILGITYGLDIKSDEDNYIQQAERAMVSMSAAGTSSYMVDFLPSLRMLPSWFPGAKFKRDAKLWSPDAIALPRDCLRFVEDGLVGTNLVARGDAPPCIATELLEELAPDDRDYVEKKRAIHDVLGAAYAAGADTTVSAFATFFLCMIQNPDIQKKAQEVIDEAISNLGRLPDFTEYKTLPYIEALVREVIRWRPVTPVCISMTSTSTAVPHEVTEDDVYKGYHIPAGATILANVYSISHDPSIYGPNPAKFNPARFMDASQTSINPDMPMGYDAFGYGRRVCPGLQIAVESIWLVVVSVLAVFDLRPEVGEKEGFVRYNSGMLIHADPFKMRFIPRSKEAVELIRNTETATNM
ncbi:hypothetical protein D9611_012042 [Ephemerocybe angulata]|uniref:Cytochrome P450 n=1 Tax=Ephemerocybe angulata TaxID=980116 RepID=A0A8H5AUG1_9AGAR|nr:hypothetical protein D9611_012042 [Tulosesus angulatus]